MYIKFTEFSNLKFSDKNSIYREITILGYKPWGYRVVREKKDNPETSGNRTGYIK